MLCRTARFLAWIALGNGLIFAQGSTGAIIGTVKDASGAVLEGAAVSAKHTETGLVRVATTGTDGNYSFPSLPVGAYEFTAEDWDSRQKCCVALIWQ